MNLSSCGVVFDSRRCSPAFVPCSLTAFDREELKEFVSNVRIHPTIDNWVGNGRRHCDDVDYGETDVDPLSRRLKIFGVDSARISFEIGEKREAA